MTERARRALLALGLLTVCVVAWAQEAPPPPAAPPAADSSGAAAPPEPAWQLPPDLLEALAKQAETYRVYAFRFSCTEEARVAHYDDAAEATDEKNQRYDYLLVRDEHGEDIREYRELLKKKGKNKEGATETTGKEVNEEERFPAAYAWVFLFSRFHQPYFMYRDLGDRFEGFDWVHEVQFRGALPFTDGKDIREWEGTVLVDAVTLTPIEVRAEPTAQRDRIRAQFDRWSKAFNIVGVHLAPRPFGYRCRVNFGYRRDRLTFPTELRYDTFRATSPKQFIPWMASVRAYQDYKFFKIGTDVTPGAPISLP